MEIKKLSAVYSVTEAALYGITMNIYQLYKDEKPPLSFLERLTFKFDGCEDEFIKDEEQNIYNTMDKGRAIMLDNIDVLKRLADK